MLCSKIRSSKKKLSGDNTQNALKDLKYMEDRFNHLCTLSRSLMDKFEL